MKLHEGCSHECLVCGATNCDPYDNSDSFARASKDILIKRYYSGDYSDEDMRKIKVWLKVQYDYYIE